MTRQSLPGIFRVQRRSQYLMLTMKGIEFADKWYYAEHVPANLTKLYQLRLELIWMKGVMEAGLAQRLGFSSLCIGRAVSPGYVKATRTPANPKDDVQKRSQK